MQKKQTKARQTQPTSIKWDTWQKNVLSHEGNITIRAGRQVGKSEVISEKAKNFAIKYPNTVTMIIAASQRQSSLLFEKVRAKIDEQGDIYAEKPTMTKIVLKNGSKIYTLPAGRTGYFIRGFTLDLLIADEAAYIPEEVWNSVIPMIAVSKKLRKKGYMILLSTPFGKGGFFYNSFTDLDFKQFHVSSESCWRIPKDFLLKEKKRLTKQEYAQEYLGEFIDDYRQFFPTQLIKKCMTFIDWTKEDRRANSKFYLGVDIARYGGDQNAFVVAELVGSKVKIVKIITTERISTTDTVGRIQKLDELWKFSKIFIDDGGLGGAVTDILLEKIGRKVMGLNNATKSLEIQGDEKKKGILKEDLYSNALMLMETGKLEMISNLDFMRSLRSITFEYTSDRNLKLFGKYSHITEAFVRACWCIKERGLKLYVY